MNETSHALVDRVLADRVAALGHVTAYMDRMPELLQADAVQLDAIASVGIFIPGAALLPVLCCLLVVPVVCTWPHACDISP